MWIFVENGTGKVLSYGAGSPPDSNFDLSVGRVVQVPQQEIVLIRMGPGDIPIRYDLYYPRDVRTFTATETAARVDRETDATIGAAIHPAAPVGEQIGILRDQLVQILNALGIEATPDFARLNSIAVEAIEAARAKKEAP